jgi:hypothetical protein
MAVLRSPSANIRFNPIGPASSCSRIEITTASAGSTISPSNGTRMIAKPNPVSPRTTDAPKTRASAMASVVGGEPAEQQIGRHGFNVISHTSGCAP